DGHRLSKAECNSGADGLDLKMLVPHKGMAELKRLAEEARGKGKGESAKVGFAASSSNAFFRRDEHLLTVKLIDEQFPPYSRVIPQQQSRRVVAARTPMIEALKRISLVANDKNHGVQLKL